MLWHTSLAAAEAALARCCSGLLQLAPLSELSARRLSSEGTSTSSASKSSEQTAAAASRRARQLVKPKPVKPRIPTAPDANQLPIRHWSPTTSPAHTDRRTVTEHTAGEVNVQALYLGREIDLKAIKHDFQYALLHSARDFCVLSSNIRLQQTQGALAVQAPTALQASMLSDPAWSTGSGAPGSGAGTGGTGGGRMSEARRALARRPNDNASQRMPPFGCLAVFQFGAAVFFAHPRSHACERPNQEVWLAKLRAHVREPVTQPRTEDVKLVLQPKLGRNLAPGMDQLLIKQWDLGNLETVSRVMGQSVALDDYHSQVDGRAHLVDQWVVALGTQHGPTPLDQLKMRVQSRLRSSPPPPGFASSPMPSPPSGPPPQAGHPTGMSSVADVALHPSGSTHHSSAGSDTHSSGPGRGDEGGLGAPGWGVGGSWRGLAASLGFSSMHMRSRMLVALLCQLDLFHSTVTRKLGMLDKDHTPWESDRHEAVWQALRRYYSIEQRNQALLTKLESVRQRAQFLLELRNGKTTHRMELTIVALITLEILVNVLGIHR